MTETHTLTTRHSLFRRLARLARDAPWMAAPSVEPAIAVVHWRPSQAAYLLFDRATGVASLAERLDALGILWARASTWVEITTTLSTWGLLDPAGAPMEPAAHWPPWAPAVLHYLPHMTIQQACARVGVTRQAHYDLRNRCPAYVEATRRARTGRLTPSR